MYFNQILEQFSGSPDCEMVVRENPRGRNFNKLSETTGSFQLFALKSENWLIDKAKIP